MTDLTKNLSQALSSFNERRVVSQKEIDDLKTAIATILSAYTKGTQTLSQELQKQLRDTLSTITSDHQSLVQRINGDLRASKAEVEQLTKQTNDRAFKRLQALIANIQLPQDGKNANPADVVPLVLEQIKFPEATILDTPGEIRDKLETLQADERLDASAIKNLPKWIERKGKELAVGGIRFFENLADVSILNKRQDLLTQYDTTNNRWHDGVALTVSAVAPASPQINDLWIDIS